MAAVVSSKHTVESIAPMGVGPRTLSNAVEGFLEVLTRVLFNQPGALPLLLQSDVEAEGRFLDRWLSISPRKYEPCHLQDQACTTFVVLLSLKAQCH